MQKANHLVICKLPKAGLGNQLFPLLKAHIFAHLNALPIVVSGFNYFKIGPYLRKEKSKRNYRNYLIFQKNSFSSLIRSIVLKAKKFENTAKEPPLQEIKINANTQSYLFTSIPHWSERFVELQPHRRLIKEILSEIISPHILTEVSNQPNPIIGIHIRMGDFKKLKDNKDFKRLGGVRTPESYFIDIVRSIREINAHSLPVSIFSDGYKNEMQNLLSMEDVHLVENKNDLVDLLLLSKSRIIVTSAGSSFSDWAGFLSESPIILHPDHIHNPIRPTCETKSYYEGPLDKNSVSLITYIKSIR